MPLSPKQARRMEAKRQKHQRREVYRAMRDIVNAADKFGAEMREWAAQVIDGANQVAQAITLSLPTSDQVNYLRLLMGDWQPLPGPPIVDIEIPDRKRRRRKG